MTDASRPAVPRKQIWRAFWILWALILAVLNAHFILVRMSMTPFAKSYMLGVDEVDEVHPISSMAWGSYRWQVIFDGPDGPVATETRAAVRDALGGDIAVELIDELGRTVMPLRFVFGDEAAWEYHAAFGYSLVLGTADDGFRPGFFDRFTLRVKTVKTAEAPHPRQARLSCRGMHGELLGIVWGLYNIVAVVVTAVSAATLLGLIRIVGGRQGTKGLSDDAVLVSETSSPTAANDHG